VTDHYVITSWYGGGLRVIDVADPAHPVPTAFFVPKPVPLFSSIPSTSAPIYGDNADPADDWQVATWSYPIIRGGLIYVSDIQNGLYILRPTAGSGLAAHIDGIAYLEGNSNLGALL
jgi:hypothetical protein